MHDISDKKERKKFDERPERLQALIDMINDTKWHKKCIVNTKLKTGIPTVKYLSQQNKNEFTYLDRMSSYVFVSLSIHL